MAIVRFAGVMFVAVLALCSPLFLPIRGELAAVPLFVSLVLAATALYFVKNRLSRIPAIAGDRFILPGYLCALAVVYLVLSINNCKGITDHTAGEWPDAVAYFVQAKIMAAGLLKAVSPPCREFFTTQFCVNNGYFFGKYPPGWPAVLSLGMRVGAPWIVNPLITVLFIFVLFRIGRLLYDRRTAWIAIILAGTSNQVLWGATGYFSDHLAMLETALFVLFSIRALQTSRHRFAVAGGIALGALFMTRPYTAVVAAVPVALLWLWTMRGNPGLLRGAVVTGIAFAPFAGLHLWYNYFLTGSALIFPFTLYCPLDRLGFGLRSVPDMTPAYYGPGNIPRGFFKTIVEISEIGIFMLPLLLIPVLFRKRTWDRFLLLMIGSFLCLNVLYFCSSIRYAMPAMFALALVGARGFDELGGFLTKRGSRESAAAAVLLSLWLMGTYALLVNLPVARQESHRQSLFMDPFLTVAKSRIDNAIVFIKSNPRAPADPNTNFFYADNAPSFSGPVLMVVDKPDKACIRKNFPGRRFYTYEFDTLRWEGRLLPMLHSDDRPASKSVTTDR